MTHSINWAEASRQARQLELQARHVFDRDHWGRFRSRFRGKGLDFDELRLYTPGDEIRDIAWSATARRGEVFVKKYHEERGRTLWIVAEDTPRLDFGRGNTTEQDPWFDRAKRRAWLESAALLLLAGARNHDRMGCWITGQRQFVIPPRIGRPVIGTLHRFVGEGISQSSTKRGITHWANKRTPRSLIVLISDFLNQAFLDEWMPLTVRHHLVAVRIVDPWEIELPNWGLVRWRDAETGQLTLVDTSHQLFRQRFAARAGDRTVELCRRLMRRKIPLVDVRTDEPMGTALIRDWPIG